MIFDIEKISIFFVGLFMAMGVSTSVYAAVDFEDLPALQKIYGDGEEVHKPGYPEADNLRVYWFWSAESSCSRRAEPAIESLVEAFPDVEVIVVHSNVDESVERAQAVARGANFRTSIYRDDGARLAIALNAMITPEVVVIDDSEVIYRGRPVRMHRHGFDSYVEDVATTWSDGAAIKQSHRRPTGCPIRRP